MKTIGLFFSLVFAISVHAQDLPPIGQWRDHLPYNNTIGVAYTGNKVYAATPYSLYYFDQEDNSIERLTKVNALSDVGVLCIAFDESSGLLVIGYQSGNVDLISVRNNTVTNLSDIKRSNLIGDKSIYSIYCAQGSAYLSTGFGIVQLDLTRKEVKDTYFLGPVGSFVKVYSTTLLGNTIYAATENGIYTANRNHPFLSDHSAWTKDLSLPTPVLNSPFRHVAVMQGVVYASYDSPNYEKDTLYFNEGSGWQVFTPAIDRDIRNIKIVSDNKMLLAYNWNLAVYDPSHTLVQNIFSYQSGAAQPSQGAFGNGFYWIADVRKGLVKALNPWSTSEIKPQGPRSAGAFQMDIVKGDVWIVSGNVYGSSWNNSYNRDYVSGRIKETWYTFDEIDHSGFSLDSTFDMVTVAIDPENASHVFAGSMSFGGLFEILDNRVINRYHTHNSTLQSWTLRPDYCGITALAFDEDVNLWVFNAYVNRSLSVRKKDGTWKSFALTSNMQNRIFKQLIVSRENGYKWVAVPPSGSANGGVFVFDDNGTIDDESDDRYRMLTTTPGAGNLPSAEVMAVAEDLDGEIWIGTNSGIAVIYTPDNVFSGGNFDAQHILIEQDGNLQILLETEGITCIAVDGANRKWIGTEGSGVYLMSEEGTQQIHHFTAENSPLLSNRIYDVKIDHLSGEVYFATDEGVVSFRGTATIEEQPFVSAYAFPNPVRPEYDGPIAIKGLARNADVKITDIAGNVVFVTKSEGGQAIWNGKNLRGERVKTGVYPVLCNSESGREKVVAKILFIN